MHRSLEQQWTSLLDQDASIESLMTSFPDVWGEVKDTVGSAVRSDRPDHINDLLLKADAAARHWHQQVRQAHGPAQRNRVLSKAIAPVARSRLIHLALKKVLTSSLGGDEAVQQSAADRWLCNHLVYLRYREHLPVRSLAMRFLWPLVRNKGAAIATAKRLGMYCFYTDRFIDLLEQRLAGKSVLEIAAGNGILTLLLKKRGINCIATDDKSWGHAVRYGNHVEDLDAAAALKKYQPDAVICSWPPPGNSFEQAVFSTATVSDYVVVGSRHQFATGARSVYVGQDSFGCITLPGAEALIAPKDIESEVLWFYRSAQCVPDSTG